MGKFVIKKAKNGVMFNLKASNGQVIATSEVYTSLDSCKKGVASVQKNCVGAIEDQTVEGFEKQKNPKFELYEDKGGKFRFRLTASNGQTIATSQGYKRRANCLKGIASVKKNAPEAEVIIDIEEE